MFRRILYIGIMTVISVIIVVALVQQRARERESRRVDDDNQTVATPRRERPIHISKYDPKDNTLLAEITGTEATGETDEGPVQIIKPKITVLKDKESPTVITADVGRIDDLKAKTMGNGWLKGNVVMTVVDKDSGDNTVIKCDEMRYLGTKGEGEIVIPGAVWVSTRSLEVSGSALTADRSMRGATLKKEVRLVLKEATEDAVRRLTGEEKQETEDGKTTGPSGHITITCDGALQYSRDESRATFEKNVVATQKETSVRGDHLVIEFERTSPAPVKPGEAVREAMTLRRVIMRSDTREGVVISSPGRAGYGDRLEYDGRAGLLVFSGAPCRTVQTSGKKTYRLEGTEVRFGRSRVLDTAERLPEGMSADSPKILLTGAPARAVSVPTEAGQSSTLTGRRILFDRDSRIVWIRGDDQFPAHGEQEKDRMTGTEIQFVQKTDTRGEKIFGRGPGRLEIGSRRQDPEKTATGPAVVEFGGDMTYLPDEHHAQFTGGVKLVDGSTTSRSRTLTVTFEKEEASDRIQIRNVVATGEVAVTGETRSATGEKLVYTYPEKGPDTLVVSLTGKSGEMCEMRTGELTARSTKIDMVETRTDGGGTTLRARGEGPGILRHEPKPDPDGAGSPRKDLEVRYGRSGSYDEAAGKGVFEGDVLVKRGDMNLAARRVVMDFISEKPPATEGPTAAERLKLTGMTAEGDVSYASGPPDSLLTAKGKSLVWDEGKGTAEIRGGEGMKDPARVVRGETELEAPLMLAFLTGGELTRGVTTGGGRLTERPQPRPGEDPGKLRTFTVTWTGEGNYETLEAGDEKTAPTAAIRMSDGVQVLSGDADVAADALEVRLGPESPAPGASPLRQEIKRVTATGSARAKMFMPEGNYYRHAKGDSLEWDRVNRQMVVMSKSDDAVVWDNSNEWTGSKLVVNRTAEGRLEAESASGRRIIFYDEGMPPSTARDARQWKPIY
ncbi:MAG TPA: LptA/OstA family protein [Planctomycetota bacterium]|nr:LptA/OstA family protein [Planctomycetota bacterium]